MQKPFIGLSRHLSPLELLSPASQIQLESNTSRVGEQYQRQIFFLAILQSVSERILSKLVDLVILIRKCANIKKQDKK